MSKASKTAAKRLRLYGKSDPHHRALYEAIMSGDNFVAGNMSGTAIDEEDREPIDGNDHYVRYRDLGNLPHEDKVKFVGDRPTYVVWSYRTPIAWFVPDTNPNLKPNAMYVPGFWRMPDTRYSNTTSRHQGLVRVAISFAEVRD